MIQIDANNFECKQCGNCCKWKGIVKVSIGEAKKISAFLKLSLEEFCDRYTNLRPDRQGLILKEKEDGSCIFLADNRCSINAVKPSQCLDFPIKWQVADINKLCAFVMDMQKNGGKTT